jgi:H+-translocating NAD(P) transhydrogenase subunit alpha
MFARNISSFLLHIVKDGKLQLNLQDEITRETLVTRDGELVNTKVREFFKLPALATAPAGGGA